MDPLPPTEPAQTRDGPFVVRGNGSYVLTTRITVHPATIPAHARFVELVKNTHASTDPGAGVATVIVSLVILALEGGQLSGLPAISVEPEPELDLSGLGGDL